MKFVGVSSCPTGIAHTYMAAEALEQEAKAQGHEMVVETQGSAGTIPLDPTIIAAADGVIFAADLEVRDKERFAGKPTVDVGVKKGVHDAKGVIAQAVAAVEAARANPQAASVAAATAAPGGAAHRGARRRQPDPPVPDDRRLVHDPVRRGGRHPHRPRLHDRWLRDRARSRGRRHHQPDARRQLPVGQHQLLGRPAVPHRCGDLRVPGPRPGRLHRLRHRRPAGPRPGLHRRCHRRRRRRRLPRRSGGRLPGRLPGAVDLPLEGAEGRPWRHARRGDAVDRVADHRRADDPGARQAARGPADRARATG